MNVAARRVYRMAGRVAAPPTKTTMRVVVSGAGGQIAYSLLPLLCRGEVFGEDIRLDLRLLDIEPALEVLDGVKMELDDCCFSLVDST